MCEGKKRLTGQGIVIQSHFPRGPTQATGQGNQDSGVGAGTLMARTGQGYPGSPTECGKEVPDSSQAQVRRFLC